MNLPNWWYRLAATPIRRVNIRLRVWLFGTLIVLCLFGLVARLWVLQVDDGSFYRQEIAKAEGNVRVRLPPVRGEIRDRRGVVMAGNRATLELEFDLPAMVQGWRDAHGLVPEVEYQGLIHQMPKTMSEPDIVQIVEQGVLPRLRELGLPVEYDARELQRHFRTDAEVPFVFARDVSFSAVADLDEHGLGLPGVRITERPVRQYPLGALAAHVLGYVGNPQQVSELADARQFQFYDPNVEGKAQVEESMNRDLEGTPGTRLMKRNLKGQVAGDQGVTPPREGDAVYLTLDARIQEIAEQTLRAVGRAGAVVVDPNNGDILAMASVPSFDPNDFIPKIPEADWKRLVDDPAAPLVSRALAAFPPGSTFKVITSLAGLTQGLADRTFTCTGGVTYGDHYFKCWNSHGHGTLHLNDAIKVSCNAFYYQYGNAAGIDAIDRVGSLLGLGQAPDLGLNGEEGGILPGPDWMRTHFPQDRWSEAQTANVSIGQGYDLVSPLQLAMVYSAVANGGTAWYPRLIDRVTDARGGPLTAPPPVPASPPKVRSRLADAGISPGDLEIVRHGFWEVVNEDGGPGGSGTARLARLPGGIVAGKTGTAQAKLHGKEDTIAWFVGFAPYDHPRYLVCVMVQGGEHGGSVAAPMAARILEQTLALDQAPTPVLAHLTPAHRPNPFQMISAVNFENPAAVTSSSPAASRAASHSAAGNSAQRERRREASPAGSPVQPAPTPANRNLFQRLFHFGSGK